MSCGEEMNLEACITNPFLLLKSFKLSDYCLHLRLLTTVDTKNPA